MPFHILFYKEKAVLTCYNCIVIVAMAECTNLIEVCDNSRNTQERACSKSPVKNYQENQATAINRSHHVQT